MPTKYCLRYINLFNLLTIFNIPYVFGVTNNEALNTISSNTSSIASTISDSASSKFLSNYLETSIDDSGTTYPDNLEITKSIVPDAYSKLASSESNLKSSALGLNIVEMLLDSDIKITAEDIFDTLRIDPDGSGADNIYVSIDESLEPTNYELDSDPMTAGIMFANIVNNYFNPSVVSAFPNILAMATANSFDNDKELEKGWRDIAKHSISYRMLHLYLSERLTETDLGENLQLGDTNELEVDISYRDLDKYQGIPTESA